MTDRELEAVESLDYAIQVIILGNYDAQMMGGIVQSIRRAKSIIATKAAQLTSARESLAVAVDALENCGCQVQLCGVGGRDECFRCEALAALSPKEPK